jgi:cold shock CspA family protein/DnaJ-domain-containing protein 1
VICQNLAELPPTWQQLRGIEPELEIDNVSKGEEKSPLIKAWEFLPSGFELLDQKFFVTQGKRGESRILKLREATWSLIIQGNYIERDQQDELLAMAEELAEFEGISLLLIRGEPGAGKTAMMRWLVYELFQQGHLVLQKKAQDEDLNWLERLREFSEQMSEQHFHVIADDLFRDELILDELAQNHIQFPFTLIGTTRLNEDQHKSLEGLGYAIKVLNVNPPSEGEKERILDKVCEDPAVQARLEDMEAADRKRLMAAPAMLVLMLQLSEGKTFAQTVADIIKNLPSTEQRPAYHVFGVICSFFQYGIAVPPDVASLCLQPQFSLEAVQDVVDCAETAELAGLVNIVSKNGAEGLVTIHELIAKTAIELDYNPRPRDNPPYSHRSLERYLVTAVKALDASREAQRRWAYHSLHRLAVVGETDLVRQVLNDYPSKIQTLQHGGTVTAWSIWASIYGALGLLDERNRCIKAILSSEPQNSSEWVDWLSLIQKLGTEQQKLDAITKTATWFQAHPVITLQDQEDVLEVRNKYLALVKKLGTLEQQQEAINQTLNWLQLLPGNTHVGARYLQLIGKLGTPKQQEGAIKRTVIWLQAHPDNRSFRLQYLRLIKKIGTPEQQQEAIEITTSWLQNHPDSQYNRIQYLKLVENIGNPEQQQKAIDINNIWLQNNLKNWRVHLQVFRLIYKLGKTELQQEINNQINIWFKNYADWSFCIDYIKLLNEIGTLEQLHKAIHQSLIWLLTAPDNWKARLQYLKLIEKLGTSEQLKEAINLTHAWFKEYPNSQYNPLQFLKWLEKIGLSEEKQNVIDISINWLQHHSDSNPLRYLKIVEKLGNPEQNYKLIELIRTWLPYHADSWQDYLHYLKLVQILGTPEQQINAIDKTTVWLQKYDDWQVRSQYLILIQKQGTIDHQQEVIDQTTNWLQEHPNDWYVRTQYLRLIDKIGTPEQQQAVINQTAAWLQNYDDCSVRAQYLVLLNKKGTPEQQQEVIEQTATWLQQHPDDTYVRTQYLDLIGKQGTPRQQQEAIQQTDIWLQEYSDDLRVRTRYLALVKKGGSLQQQQEAIKQTATWLQGHPEYWADSYIRSQYLILLGKQGTPQQQREAIEQTTSLLQGHPEHWADSYIRSQYGKALVKDGDLNKAIVELCNSFEINERLNNCRGLEIVTPVLIQTLMKLEQHDKALAYYQRALAVAPKNQRLLELRDQISSPQRTTPETVLKRGSVKRVLRDVHGYRYGYIAPNDGSNEIRFDERSIDLDSLSKLTQGTRVEVEVKQTPKGLCAKSIRIIAQFKPM